FILFMIVLIHMPLAAAQPLPWQLCNYASGNYTANSTYRANMQNLASSLPDFASTSPSLFAAGKSGTIPDAVYALALCRGDCTNASFCAACVSWAIQAAPELCPLIKEVTIFNEPCILRFSNEDFPHNPLDNRWMILTANGSNVSAAVAPTFTAAVGRLVNATIEYAAADPVRRFGTGEEAFDKKYPKIYALAQCTPDLTSQDCRTCLKNISAEVMPNYFVGPTGGRIYGVRCNLRYETFPFFNGQPLVQLQSPFGPPPSSPPQAAGGFDSSAYRRRDKRTGVLVAIVVPSVAAVLCTLVVTCLYFWRLRKRQPVKLLRPDSTSSDDIPSIDSLLIDLSTLQVATDYFGEHKRLGEGGFGVVYKGDLPDGQEIAVKRLSQTSRQGIEELRTELLSVAKLNHKNLVRLVGVCLEEREKILVYEYMPNRSLDTFIFDAVKVKEMDWSKRFRIIHGITRGLQYLHEDSQLKIVHRDLKASNILLDSDYNPKISDFGLAKIFGGDQSHIVTHRIAGTYGYMSPEYAMRGQYSTKSDVFSLGVLILEIVTGRRNSGFYDSDQDVDLINITWEHWTREKAVELIDPSLRNCGLIDQLLKCIHIGLLCVQQKTADRPSMSAVNHMLTSNDVHLPSLTRPAFCNQEIGANSEPNLVGNARRASSNEVTITELAPR
ncbi:cysteine-rich receptor-like protein kinase 10, partial [Lolium rigidum]|uniref:cysteine-rich receptor-like protein kinase 10 n=1 Tax=Lolium rigidum TaxID=89674 RepID=UPI001F5C3E5C